MKDARSGDIETFLERNGWGEAARAALAGDASGRRYLRLRQGRDSAVLMDADPATGERVDAFLRVGRWLAAQGYSAPAILAVDEARGLLLLEDLGDALFARLVAGEPARERDLYLGAIAFLIDLHSHRPPAFLAVGDGPAMADLVALMPKWYLPGVDAAPSAEADRIAPLVGALYARFCDMPPVVSPRDFHAENLIWLPKRTGVAKVGLLDFQDAFATHPAYDLVSLLQDARREASVATEAGCLTAYIAHRGLDQSRFSAAYALLGAQRALRIIGIFARLCMHFGKPRYLAFAPRVWANLERNLAHPALTDLAAAVHQGLPPLTPERLQRIADKCGTCPTP